MACKRMIIVPLSGVTVASAANNQKLTFTLPLEQRYSRIDIVYIDGGSSPNLITAAFSDLEIQKNGKTVRIWDVTDLDAINGTNGTQYLMTNLTTGSGAAERQVLPLFFQEPWRKSTHESDLLAWNVSRAWGWNNFTINLTVKLSGGLPSTASVVIYAYVDAVLPVPQGGSPIQNAKLVRRYDIAAAGSNNDYTINADGYGYQAFYIKNPTGAYLQYHTIKVDGVLYRERIIQGDNITAMEAAGIIPATSTSAGAMGNTIVLDWDDPLNSYVVPQNQLWFHFEYSAAASGNVRMYAEVYGPLPN